jgi:predicted nucleic acid-binding protein
MASAERVVLDTSVLVAAARSRLGASFAIVSAIPSPKFQVCLSVSLYAEWQDAMTRSQHLPPDTTPEHASRFLRYLATQAWLQDIFYLWRPFLADPDDDMILELAFAAGCRYIITHNVRDFAGCEQLGVSAITPGKFLKIITEGGQS